MAASSQEIYGKEFDYIVVGGGTAGLAVAARLAEDPGVTVIVLEAGPENLNDTLIDVPAQMGSHSGVAKYDWDFRIEPQKNANGAAFPWTRGRTLGGSSAINYFAWTRPPVADVDNWEKLGNPGWNWDQFYQYSKKSEMFTPSTDANREKYRQIYNAVSHGMSGPVQTGFPEYMMEGDLQFQDALFNVGVPPAKDPLGGDPIGTCMVSTTIDGITRKRSHAATAYYIPNKDKRNFCVLCDALVLRVITKSNVGEYVEADGVEFEHDRNVHLMRAKREVILSAGALKTPQLLELSGIGDKRILDRLGIPTLVDLPGVGANVQEHHLCSIVYELDPARGFITIDPLKDESFAAEQLRLYREGRNHYSLTCANITYLPFSLITNTPEEAQALILKQRESVQKRHEAGELDKALYDQLSMQLETFKSGTGGDCELMCFPGYTSRSVTAHPEPGKTYTTIELISNHALSRGTIHSGTADPHDPPVIDPHYFEEELDLDVLVEMAKFCRRIAETEPFTSIIVKETVPGPACASDAQLRKYMKDCTGTSFHTIASASMLPRDCNGVVDPKLRVYGTKNLRIVDLSIVPLNAASHTQSIAYAIAEQAADIIKLTPPF